jgi:predicted ATPase
VLRRLSVGQSDEDRAAWNRITRSLQAIAPFIKRLDPTLVDPSALDTSLVRLHWFDQRDHRFDVHDLSDGTLRALALITCLCQPVSRLPAFICIDEPELGLHPAALGLVVGLARSVLPHAQVVFATQSARLLDEFSPSEVVVVEREEHTTRLRRLDEAQLAEWLDEYRLSDLYDKNVLGGRP